MPLSSSIRRLVAGLAIPDRLIEVDRSNINITEGRTQNLRIRLQDPPRVGQTVRVTITSADAGAVSVGTAALTFNLANHRTWQTVVLTGETDADATNETVSITVAATGGGYETSRRVSATVADTSNRSVFVSDRSISLSSGRLSQTVNVRLNTQPTGTVTVAITDNSARFAASTSSLTFTTTNWSVNQVVTISATDGNNASGTMTFNPSGADYGSVASVTASLSFAAASRVIETDVNSITVAEDGTARFQVRLSGAPIAGQDVTVTAESNDNAEATVSRSSRSLTFDGTNFRVYQNVSVEGVGDNDTNNENTSIALEATGGGYSDTTSVAVTVTDDDTASLRVSDTSLSFSSTTLSRTISVRLGTQPSGDVTVAITDNSGRFSSNPTSLTFTDSNWNTNQIVTVRATAGGTASGTLTLNPSGGGYDMVPDSTVGLTFTLTLPGKSTVPSLSARYTNNNTQQQIRATWSAGARATSQEFRHKKTTDSNWTAVTGLSGTSYTIPNVSPNTTYEGQAQSRNASGPSGWTVSGRVTTGRSRGNLYLGTGSHNRLYRMAGGYSTSGTWDSGIANPSNGSGMTGIAFDAAGNLLAVNTSGGSDRVFRMAGGYSTSGSWDSGIAASPGGEELAVSLAVAPNGDLLLAGGRTFKIFRMAGGYSTSGTWDSGISIPALSGIGGIAFDTNGDLLLASGGTNKIFRMAGGYSTSGTWDSGINVPSGVTSPRGLAVDGGGNFVLCDAATDKIYRRSSGSWDSGVAVPSGVTDPFDLAID